MERSVMDMITDEQHTSIIKVVGVGSFGVRALNYMYERGIEGVDFFVCNTDKHDLSKSKVPVKIPIGTKTLQGFGAGGDPKKGEQAVIEDYDKIAGIFEKHAKMVFIASGMGGGTGTGAAPMIAKIAKEKDLLTIAVLSLPPLDEGEERMEVAINGIREVAKYADSVLIINNEKVFELYGENENFFEAKESVYKVLNTAVKGISELITLHGYINLDFADVRTVTINSGVAVMGAATTSGENRALDAIKKALTSPLLMSSDVRKAKQILLNISFNPAPDKAVKLSELDYIANYVDDAIGEDANIITGVNFDETLDGQVAVTIIATGFELEGVLDKRYLAVRVNPFEEAVNTKMDKPINRNVPIFEGERVWLTPDLDEKTIIEFMRVPAHTRRQNKFTGSKRKTSGVGKKYRLEDIE